LQILLRQTCTATMTSKPQADATKTEGRSRRCLDRIRPECISPRDVAIHFLRAA